MAGDRVKTDRRDAAKLARLSAANLLTPVFVPDEEMEALRDLVRCREAAKQDVLRARHRVSKFLLRHGRQKPKDIKKSWTLKHIEWLNRQTFEKPAQEATFKDLLHEFEHQVSRVKSLEKKIDEMVVHLPVKEQAVVQALQAMRGIAQLTAVTIVTEVGDLSRFSHPTQLMAYAGLVPREHSSGDKIRRGGITKSGNAHLRRVVGESAWAYRFKPRVGYALKVRQRDVSSRIQDLAMNAQRRLNERYRHLQNAGKHHNKVIGAVARELLGFVWHIGLEAEREYHQRTAA
jgi:transposase